MTTFNNPVYLGKKIGAPTLDTIGIVEQVREFSLDASVATTATYAFPNNAFLIGYDVICTTNISATDGIYLDVGTNATSNYYGRSSAVTTAGVYSATITKEADSLGASVKFTMTKVTGGDTLNAGVVKVRLRYAVRS